MPFATIAWLRYDMFMAYIFLDESGNFSKSNDGKYFVIAAFTIGDPRRAEKRFRAWHRSHFPAKIRYFSEIKFSGTHIADALRIKTLQFITELDVRIRFIYLKRENIPDEYYHKNSLKSGHLYTHVIGEILEMFLPITDGEFRVFCDRRHLKDVKVSEFKEILTTRLLPKFSKDALIRIEMVDSTTNANIQIADWIAGALAHYLEEKKLGKKFYEILKNNILGEGTELFKDHWAKKYNRKKTA